jgi:Zn-dependent protease with chaperone function
MSFRPPSLAAGEPVNGLSRRVRHELLRTSAAGADIHAPADRVFSLAVIGVVLAVNAVAAIALGSTVHRLDVRLHVLVTLATLVLIAAGTIWETLSLRSGGDAVAKMIGARPIDPGSRDLLERRLLNVVEEMALASGTPVPRVYLMDDEAGINAFAAGHTVNDAVVAVTRGTLTRLTRDELQGVVAHEFSHILNGDMRLNVRLIAVLFGLTMVSTVGR